MTISGVAIGRKIRVFVRPEPRKRYRTRARAISVPSAVATIVEMNATPTLVWTTSNNCGTAKGCNHASSVKPCHATLLLPGGSLKLNRAMTATGNIR
jgi:hypothetical protein